LFIINLKCMFQTFKGFWYIRFERRVEIFRVLLFFFLFNLHFDPFNFLHFLVENQLKSFMNLWMIIYNDLLASLLFKTFLFCLNNLLWMNMLLIKWSASIELLLIMLIVWLCLIYLKILILLVFILFIHRILFFILKIFFISIFFLYYI